MERYCLDAWALLALLRRENPAALRVKALLETAAAQKERGSLFLSMINLGEIYYIIGRAKGVEEAEQTAAQIQRLPLIIISVDDNQVMAAARLKMSYPISYADAFALATAVQTNATLVTGDPELTALAADFPIEPLSRS
jgi:predicted nucleic acid-binding protein